MAAGALAAAAVVGVAVGSGALSDGGPTGVQPVPMVDKPYERAATDDHIPEPEPAKPGTPRCDLADFEGAQVRVAGSDDEGLVEVTIRNAGATCALATSPSLVVRDATGKTKAPEKETDTVVVQQQVEVMEVGAGAGVSTRLLLSGRECRTYVRVGIDLEYLVNGGEARIRPDRAPTCAASPLNAGSAKHGPWLPGLLPLTSPPAPLSSDIEVEIDDVRAPAAGLPVDFVVDVTNSGSQDFAFEPCPGYRAVISDGEALGTEVVNELNCAALPAALGPGETVRLQMRLETPPGLREASLGRFLGEPFGPTSPSAVVPVELGD